MVSRIKTVQRNKKRMITEELKAVLAERDEAVERVGLVSVKADSPECCMNWSARTT